MPRKGELAKGVVIRASGGYYHVQVDDKVYVCTLRGRVKKQNLDPQGRPLFANPVAVGDEVMVTIADDKYGAIEEILPRRTKFSRRLPGKPVEQLIVANADQVVIISSIKMPDLNLRFIDRFLILAEAGGLEAVICVNKMDLASPEERAMAAGKMKVYEELGYRVLYTSALTGEGIDELKGALKDKFSVFVGESGVGKSTLLNTIQPGLGLKVAEVSEKTGKGRHTTSFVQRVPLHFGGYAADTPGVREVRIWGVNEDELDRYFPEMRPYIGQCKYKDCTHIHEPDCAVKQAVMEEKIHPSRYESYLRLRRGEA